MPSNCRSSYCSVMFRLPTTPKQDPAGLHSSLAVSPLLAVLRPSCSTQAEQQVAAAAGAGFRHVELSWNAEPWWFDLLLDLQRQGPLLRFGAATTRPPESPRPTIPPKSPRNARSRDAAIGSGGGAAVATRNMGRATPSGLQDCPCARRRFLRCEQWGGRRPGPPPHSPRCSDAGR